MRNKEREKREKEGGKERKKEKGKNKKQTKIVVSNTNNFAK
jgi:hypothetical protein